MRLLQSMNQKISDKKGEGLRLNVFFLSKMNGLNLEKSKISKSLEQFWIYQMFRFSVKAIKIWSYLPPSFK